MGGTPGYYASDEFNGWENFDVPASGKLEIRNKEFQTPNDITKLRIESATIDLNAGEEQEYVLRGTYSRTPGGSSGPYDNYPFTVRMICKPLSSPSPAANP